MLYFAINWPEPQYQWLPFVSSDLFAVGNVPSHKAWLILVAIRRILVAFRASSQGDPILFGELLERHVVGSNQSFRAALTALRDMGIVYRQQDNEFLSLANLSAYGISYASSPNLPVSTRLFKESDCGRLQTRRRSEVGESLRLSLAMAECVSRRLVAGLPGEHPRQASLASTLRPARLPIALRTRDRRVSRPRQPQAAA